MKITVFTSFPFSATSIYTIKKLRTSFSEVKIVAVNRNSKSYRKQRRKNLIKKARRLGFIKTIKNLALKPFLRKCQADWSMEVKTKFISLVKPEDLIFELDYFDVVTSVNGPDAIEAIRQTEPDILLQLGAGILLPGIFNLPTICTLNMHHGIAPKIRGGCSIFWGVYYGRPEWVGVTIHQIDKGIDTGKVLKRKQIEFEYGTHPAHLHAEAFKEGITLLIECLNEIQEGKFPMIDTVSEESVYLSFYNSKQYNCAKKRSWQPVTIYTD